VNDVPKCSGTLKILNSRVAKNTDAAGKATESIEWLQFEVELFS
jgi:hypothetical protein